MDRKTLIFKHDELTKDLEKLRQELATYSEQDSVEVDKKRNEMQQSRLQVDKYTDHILSMESWLKDHMGGDPEQLMQTKRMLYDDEFDEEEGGLREV